MRNHGPDASHPRNSIVSLKRTRPIALTVAHILATAECVLIGRPALLYLFTSTTTITSSRSLPKIPFFKTLAPECLLERNKRLARPDKKHRLP